MNINNKRTGLEKKHEYRSLTASHTERSYQYTHGKNCITNHHPTIRRRKRKMNPFAISRFGGIKYIDFGTNQNLGFIKNHGEPVHSNQLYSETGRVSGW